MLDSARLTALATRDRDFFKAINSPVQKTKQATKNEFISTKDGAPNPAQWP
jgi:hypothetical protein